MNHKDWCSKQKGCITPGAKPCRMCEAAYNASHTFISQEKLALYCIAYDLRVTDETGDRVPDNVLALHVFEGTKKIRTMDRPARPGILAHTAYFLEAV